MKVRFALSTKFCFSEPVTGHVFRLRPVPPELAGQHVESYVLRTSPEVKLCALAEPVLGNLTWTGRIDAPHESLEVACEGVVDLAEQCVNVFSAADESKGEEDEEGAEVEHQAQGDANAGLRESRTIPVVFAAPYFVRPTPLTAPGPHVTALWNRVKPEVEKLSSAREKALFLMHVVHAALSYKPGATTTQTSADQALAIGAGVCQDYSHVLISLLRLAEIPALYAAGLVEGVGATHAWVEAWVGERKGINEGIKGSDNGNEDGEELGKEYGTGKGAQGGSSALLALDPTHDVEARGAYVVLARGCDFAEAALERGVFRGRAAQSIVTRAEVKRLSAPAGP